MPNSTAPSLRDIPSVDRLIRSQDAVQLRRLVGDERMTAIAREIANQLRMEVQSGQWADTSPETLLASGVERLRQACETELSRGLRRVINATGVILHTNLGRAPLSEGAQTAIANASGYCTLEYDLNSGQRGKRAGRAEELLVQLTGAEAGLVVNNCASAALLVLSVLARDGETIVSRGELVEIGGDFRVPDVMANSGTRMVEVGTTNRTRLEDYRRAINASTRLIMRVHPSNYRIVGFTASPDLATLSSLAHEAGLLLYEDAGSGALSNLTDYGLKDEPLIRESIAAGADVVSFSGDKLLGGPQAGLIVGRGEIVTRLRKHSLYRALRADKLCLAALEATLETHLRGALQEIPAFAMLAFSAEAIEQRAQALIQQLKATPDFVLETNIIGGESAIGGGSGPNVHPATALIALKHERMSADEIERKLRSTHTPVVARIADGSVLIDLRTVDPSEEAELINVLNSIKP